MKTLLLARHAKANWDNSFGSDFDRKLNQRGLSEAKQMAELIAEKIEKVDIIFSSPAVRALETALFFANVWKIEDSKIVTDLGIYESSYTIIPKIIMSLANGNNQKEVEKIIFLGHNPDMTYLINSYLGTNIENFPTCSIACIDFEVETWKEILPKKGKLRFIKIPEK